MTWPPWEEHGTCEECRFWADREGDTGHCHRFPPQVTVYVSEAGGEVIRSEWPTTKAGDSCGEFEAEEAA